jgi:hypothetical protein
MTDVTHILSAIEEGDPHAAEQLWQYEVALPTGIVLSFSRILAATRCRRALTKKSPRRTLGGFSVLRR